MKTIGTIFVAVLFIGNVIAKDYFTFNLEKIKTKQNKEIKIEFNYNFAGYEVNNFLVRPRVSRGKIEIYSVKNNTWVSQNGLWTDMPNLEKEMMVKILLTGDADVWFEIQNILDYRIYITPKQKVWGGNLYGNYINQLNQNLMYLKEEEELIRQVKEETEPEERFSFLTKVIKYIDEII